jgi:glycosyltransferase involved in cell wall biosynthesis
VRLLVAIPVYNERKTVAQVLDKVRLFGHDILAVDDGSTDGTGEILWQRDDVFTLRHERNRGYGRSLIDAFQWADARGYDWVLTMDCDRQHEPESIPDFVRLIRTDQYDIVSGSRYLLPRMDDDLPPADRRSVNATITELVNDLLRLEITDAFCGFKAHRTCAMMRLELTENGYGFPMQFWPRAAATGLRLTETPVRLIYTDPSRHFGGSLDDAGFRMRHYLDILQAELSWKPAPLEVGACG